MARVMDLSVCEAGEMEALSSLSAENLKGGGVS